VASRPTAAQSGGGRKMKQRGHAWHTKLLRTWKLFYLPAYRLYRQNIRLEYSATRPLAGGGGERTDRLKAPREGLYATWRVELAGSIRVGGTAACLFRCTIRYGGLLFFLTTRSSLPACTCDMA